MKRDPWRVVSVLDTGQRSSLKGEALLGASLRPPRGNVRSTLAS